MNRREAIQRTAMVLGYTVSAPLVTAVLNGCKAKPETAFVPKYLDQYQATIVSALAETIIPRTDTPGAIDAGVPGFIDDLFGTVYSKEQQQNFIDGINNFGMEAEGVLNTNFDSATPEARLSYVKELNSKLLAGGGSAQSEGWWAAGAGKSKPFFLEMKELTLLGFFTSEAGATKVLQYNQVPGPFKGCVPLTQVGKAWAT